MTLKTDSLVDEVRRLKEENAAEYGHNVRAIGAAARLHQLDHPERIVSREVETTVTGTASSDVSPPSEQP